MKEGFIYSDRTIVAHDQSAKIAEPSQGAFHLPTTAVPAMRCDQLDPACGQPFAQRIAVVSTIGDHPQGFLAWPSSAMTPGYANRRERFFREPRFVRGGRVKLLSQRKTLAVDHHHPLRAFATLGFSDLRAPFLAGAKLPSRNDARQMVSQMPCSSQSRSRRQQVAGEGNSSGKSCQRAPLRKIHKMPSRTLRSFAGGRPPCRDLRTGGSKGRIFSHWASVSSRPYRAIGPPLALLSAFIAQFWRSKHHGFKQLYPVLK